jgi:hypothetical protein
LLVSFGQLPRLDAEMNCSKDFTPRLRLWSNPDPKFDAALGRESGIALDHAGLHLDRAAYSVDHTAEFDKTSVAGALHYAPAVYGDRRVNEIAA